MPKELRPKSIPEFLTGICYLPVVIELKENGKRIYFLVQNQAGFDADRANSCEQSKGICPTHDEMKRLASTHGREMSKEEFESGKVWPSLEAEGYTEYRFKAPEAAK